MAEITLLTPEQVAEREQKPKGQGRSGRKRSGARTRIIEEFKAVMRDVTPGFGADVFLSEGEDKRVVRQNLIAAAEELNVALDFRPLKDKSRIHFRFITPEEKAARPKRGGRPRKNLELEPAASDEAPVEAQEVVQSVTQVMQEQPAESPKKRTRKPRATRNEAPS